MKPGLQFGLAAVALLSLPALGLARALARLDGTDESHFSLVAWVALSAAFGLFLFWVARRARLLNGNRRLV